MEQPNYKITHGHNFRDRENNLESELLNVFSNRAPRSQFVVDIYQPASLFQDNRPPLCNRSSGISVLEKNVTRSEKFPPGCPFQVALFPLSLLWVKGKKSTGSSFNQSVTNVCN